MQYNKSNVSFLSIVSVVFTGAHIATYINKVNISMQACCQLQRRPTFLPSNFYFLRARQGGRSHHATNYESGAKCSADIRVPLAPPSGSAVAAGLRSFGVLPAPEPPRPDSILSWETRTGVCGRDLRVTTYHATPHEHCRLPSFLQ